MRERVRPLMLVVLFLLLCTAGTALGAAELTPEQTIQVRRVSDLQLSPDGSRVAFVVTEPPVGDRENRDIYVLEVAANQVRRFTTSPKPDRSPRWSPDGKRIAFIAPEAKTEEEEKREKEKDDAYVVERSEKRRSLG